MLSLITNTLDYCMSHKHTVVFGNLGRKHHLIEEYLSLHYPNFQVIVISKYYNFKERNHVVMSNMLSKCDLLIYIEPDIDTTISDYSGASRIIVFTSHNFIHVPSSFIHIDFYLPQVENEVEKSQRLLAIQDASVSHRSIDIVKSYVTNHFNVKTLSRNVQADIIVTPGKPYPVWNEKSYLILDTTSCRNITQIFLWLLDLYDVLKYNVEFVDKWVISFPEKIETQFHYFTQKFIDAMVCKNDKSYIQTTLFFEIPNSIPSNELEQVPKQKFFGYNIYLPQNEQQACLINAYLNLIPVKSFIFIEKIKNVQ